MNILQKTGEMSLKIDMTRWDWESMPPGPGWRRHPFRACTRLVHAGWAFLCLIAALTVLATIPGLNLYSLGYLLGSQERVARTGRFRDALILLPAASRLIWAIVAVFVFLWPVGWLAGLARESWLISSGSTSAWLLTAALAACTILAALHVSRALLCGGALREFFRPDRTLRWLLSWNSSSVPISDLPVLLSLWRSLRFWHHMRLGLLGYLMVYILLAVPTWMYAAMHDASRITERAMLFAGFVLLTLLLAFLPVQLVHMAVANEASAFFDFRSAFRRFRTAPFSHLFASVLLFGLSVLLPLYQALYKIQIPPHGIVWDVVLLTILLTLPGRLVTAWAWHRGETTQRAWRIWIWLCGIGILASTGAYVLFVMLAASGGKLGSQVVWQHHPLLLPWPF